MIKRAIVYEAPRPFDRTFVWDTSQEFLRKAAFVDLFNLLDKQMDAYSHGLDSVVCSLLHLARAGNPEACEALLVYRKSHRGETFQEIEVTSPFRLEPEPVELAVPKCVEVPLPDDSSISEDVPF